MSDPPIIDAFEQFAGRENLRKFIDAACGVCLRKGRLMFWQESLWRKFSEHNPNAPQEPQEILSIFRYCPVHSRRLRDCNGMGFDDDIRRTPECDQAREELFPYATTQLRCVDCESRRKTWISDHQDLCRILRRRTTYEDYCQRLFGDTEIYEKMKPDISKRTAEIASEMRDGDELWEWDTGGWHELAGRGGVAIVRDGEIVKKWCELRS